MIREKGAGKNMAEVELTYMDIEAEGIDTPMIRSCKKFRQLAKLDRLRMISLLRHQSLLSIQCIINYSFKIFFFGKIASIGEKGIVGYKSCSYISAIFFKKFPV